MAAPPPPVEESKIERRVGRRGLRRGRDYFLSGAIFNTRRQGYVLKGCCAGRAVSAYRVQATLDAQGVVDASCTCPVGASGSCKHVAALLIAWREKPQEFIEVEPLPTMLARYSREQLVELIEQLVSRRPELETLIETAMAGTPVIHVPPSPESYRDKVVALLRSREEEAAEPADVAASQLAGLRSIKESGDALAKRRELASAAEVYRAIVDEVLRHVEQTHDDLPAGLGELIDECVQALGRMLGEIRDPAELRMPIMQTIWAVYRFELVCQGTVRNDLPDLLVQYASANERAAVSAWARELLAVTPSRMCRRALGALVLQLDADRLDDEGFLAICRQSGRTLELVRRLVQRGRIAEALAEARQADACDLLKSANLLVRYRHGEEAVKLVKQCYQTTHCDESVRQWLQRWEAARVEQHDVLRLTEQLFRLQPDLDLYRRLRKLGREMNQWDALHGELLSFLEQSGHIRLLVTIHLDENDIDRALELLDSPAMEAGGVSLALEVARAAEHSRPEEALAIYRAHAERLIEQQDPESFKEACLYLRRVRSLMRRTGGTQNWANYVSALREHYASVKPLLVELDAAEL